MARLARFPFSVRLRSRAALALLVPYVALILFLTLTPGDRLESAGALECLICGTRGLADVILNIILFIPVGLLATLSAGASVIIVVAAGVFSAGVEIAQFFIPGRDASPPDLLFNTTGALLGVVLGATERRWLRPRHATFAALLMSLVVTGIVQATSWFSTPTIEHEARWFVWWNADLGHLEPYDGVVSGTAVGGVQVRGNGWIDSALRDSLAARLAAGDPIDVRTTAGHPPAGLAGLFAIYDSHATEIVLVGPDGDDLVVHLHMRAEAVRLDKPEVRLKGALAAYEPGDTLDIQVTRNAGNYCIGVGESQSCGLGMDVSLGWTLLMQRARLPEALAFLVQLGWCFGLAVLLGFYARTGIAAGIAGVAWIWAFLAAPATNPYLLLTPWPAFGAAVVGFLIAAWIGVRLDAGSARPVEDVQAG